FFLSSLPSNPSPIKATRSLAKPRMGLLAQMRQELTSMRMLPDDEQGYALEVFLNKLFINCGLAPQAPLRLQGQEVSGQVIIYGKEFVISARANTQSSAKELCDWSADLGSKSAKGLMISLPPFTQELQQSLCSGATKNVIAVDLKDLMLVLDGGVHLEKMI